MAVSAWSHVVACVLAPRLFCAFGSVAPPCPFDPSPMPPAPLLLRLHSPRIPLALRLFFPFAFRSHSVFIPSATLCVSGGRGVGSGCRVGGGGSECRVGVAALPLPMPLSDAHRHAPAPSPLPPPLPGGGKDLRLLPLRGAAAFQSSDLRSRSALIKLFRYLPLFGKVESQYSFSWSSLKDIIF